MFLGSLFQRHTAIFPLVLAEVSRCFVGKRGNLAGGLQILPRSLASSQDVNEDVNLNSMPYSVWAPSAKSSPGSVSKRDRVFGWNQFWGSPILTPPPNRAWLNGQECCVATCRVHTCGDGYTANPSYVGNTGDMGSARHVGMGQN